MHWESNRAVFTLEKVKKFAKENGWEYVDSVVIPADTLAKWKEGGFKFSYTDDFWEGYSNKLFPLKIVSNSKLLRFKTGIIAVEPGNANETDVNGYVLVSDNGKQMAVYHLWGE